MVDYIELYLTILDYTRLYQTILDSIIYYWIMLDKIDNTDCFGPYQTFWTIPK